MTGSKYLTVFLNIALATLTSILVGSFHPADSKPNDNASFYSDWADSLSKYVDPRGNVDYKGWKRDQGQLNSFLKSLELLGQSKYSSMGRDEQLALWINAYNAYTVKVVLDHYPIKRSGLNLYPSNSIRQIDGAWDKYKLSVAGRRVSLSEIENKILREEFREPLIHFAINCASKSCPKLLNKPYLASSIRYQLETSTRSFMADEQKNKFDQTKKRISISSIFQWYRDDFKKSMPSKTALPNRSITDTAIIKFIEKYGPDKHRDWLSSNDFKLEYLPYDWSLNERR